MSDTRPRKHDGCYDCGSMEDEILTSISCTRLFGMGPDRSKWKTMFGSFALCKPCYDKEVKARG